MNGNKSNPPRTGNYGGDHRGRRDFTPPADPIKDEWITQAINDDAIAYCDKYGKTLSKKGLTTSQIRNFYGEVMRIKGRGFDREEEAVLMLRPKLAYATFRKGSEGSKMLKEILDPALKLAAKDAKAFHNFCQMFEALLAFHKAYGGRD